MGACRLQGAARGGPCTRGSPGRHPGGAPVTCEEARDCLDVCYLNNSLRSGSTVTTAIPTAVRLRPTRPPITHIRAQMLATLRSARRTRKRGTNKRGTRPRRNTKSTKSTCQTNPITAALHVDQRTRHTRRRVKSGCWTALTVKIAAISQRRPSWRATTEV